VTTSNDGTSFGKQPARWYIFQQDHLAVLLMFVFMTAIYIVKLPHIWIVP